jgi:hypothetical protein
MWEPPTRRQEPDGGLINWLPSRVDAAIEDWLPGYRAVRPDHRGLVNCTAQSGRNNRGLVLATEQYVRTIEDW